jgi:hypothetical protein
LAKTTAPEWDTISILINTSAKCGGRIGCASAVNRKWSGLVEVSTRTTVPDTTLSKLNREPKQVDTAGNRGFSGTLQASGADDELPEIGLIIKALIPMDDWCGSERPSTEETKTRARRETFTKPVRGWTVNRHSGCEEKSINGVVLPIDNPF